MRKCCFYCDIQTTQTVQKESLGIFGFRGFFCTLKAFGFGRKHSFSVVFCLFRLGGKMGGTSKNEVIPLVVAPTICRRASPKMSHLPMRVPCLELRWGYFCGSILQDL